MSTNTATLYKQLKTELGMTDREIVAHFPPRLGEIHRAVGVEATLALIEGASGGQVYIPSLARMEDTRLFQLVGASAAERMIEICGEARHVVVPNPVGNRFWKRRRSIEALKKGWSINQVASHFGVSFNSVRGWRKLVEEAA